MFSCRLHWKNSVFLILFNLLFLTCCSEKSELQIKYGNDADYFIGLKLLEEKSENQARIKFNHCIKKGSYYCAKKSAEALCTFGTIQEKNKAAIFLAENFKEPDSILTAAKILKESDEINQLLEITKNTDYSKDDNNLIKIRLEAMKKRGDSEYENNLYKWFTLRPVSEEHYQFYRDIADHPDFDEIETEISENNQTDSEKNENNEEESSILSNLIYTPEQFVINYRIELYKRNYTYTFKNAGILIDYFEKGTIALEKQLASDLGKTYLYGDASFVKNAYYFGSLAQKYAGTGSEFYFWFYCGRLFSKANLYSSQAIKAFSKAMECADETSLKDNALWYLLNASLTSSFDDITAVIKKYAPQWSDPEYFEDFFDTLVTSLLAAGRWNSFGEIYRAIDGYATNSVTAHFAYIYARLCQEGLADGDKSAIEEALKRACRCDSSVYGYYGILAATQLGFSGSELEQMLLAMHSSPQTYTGKSEAANRLLEGYADFGFSRLIYSEWKNLKSEEIKKETALKCADFLRQCGSDTNDFYTQSLRIAADTLLHGGEVFSKKEMELIYPKNFAPYVTEACTKYGLEEEVMYALIRSESFFDPDVESSAGAIGLTQLMELTGGDIARKLKFKDYSLSDAKTNILFGTYYLSELYSRCDNSMLQAFFAYNAGITRVRRWLQSSLTEFGKKKDMPLDLFLESLPYSETREYGRKLLTATIMYKMIYSNDENTVSDLTMAVNELLQIND